MRRPVGTETIWLEIAPEALAAEKNWMETQNGMQARFV
jgi:hypothetical protein